MPSSCAGRRFAAGRPDLLARPGFQAHDQWTVQIQAQIQLKAEDYINSDGLSDDEIHLALLTPLHDLPSTLEELRKRYGPRTCILPDGPLTLPMLTRLTLRSFQT
jgi:hypothetical protein